MRSVPFVLVAVLAAVDAYYYTPGGPWELENALRRARAACRAGADINEATLQSDGGAVDCGRVDAALFRVAEAVEGAVVRRVVRAIDAEVETLFPHHARTRAE